MGIECILDIFPLVQMVSAANHLNHVSVNSFWCLNLFILISKRISLAKVLNLLCEHNFLGPRTPYVSLPMNCLAQLHSKEISTSFSSIYSLGCDFYDGS